MRELLAALADDDVGWHIPTGVQDEATSLLGAGDVMVAAETGSGKTGAFALPILQLVYEQKQRLTKSGVTSTFAHPSKRPRLNAHWNADDRDPELALCTDSLTIQCREYFAWKGVRANVGSEAGAAYFEGTVLDEGICRIGWSAHGADRNLGVCALGYGFGGTGMKSNAKSFVKYGEAFGKGDVIGSTLDWTSRTISFSKNGDDLGVAFHLSESVKGPLFPAVVVKNAEMSFNFGATPFAFPPTNNRVVGVDALKWANPTHDREKGVTALVIAPTRDLAQQIYESFCSLSRYLQSPRVTSCLLVGGLNTKREEAALKRGEIDIVIGTPGKTFEFVKRKILRVESVSTFVLDEADRLLDEGTLPVIMDIYGKLSRAVLERAGYKFVSSLPLCILLRLSVWLVTYAIDLRGLI